MVSVKVLNKIKEREAALGAKVIYDQFKSSDFIVICKCGKTFHASCNTKRLICNDCLKRYGQNSSTQLIQKMMKAEEEYGVTIMEVIQLPADRRVTFVCNCGKQADRSVYQKKLRLLCDGCLAKEISENARNRAIKGEGISEQFKQRSREEVYEFFRRSGAELLTEYVRITDRVSYRCKCGTIWSKSRLCSLLENKNVMCPRCRSVEIGRKNRKRDIPLSNEEIKRSSPENRWWERAVKRIYGYKCCISGETKDLCSHHLQSYATNPDLRLDTTNGVCLTRTLHHEFHMSRGSYSANFSRKDFEDFYKAKTGKDFSDLIKYLNFERYEDTKYFKDSDIKRNV